MDELLENELVEVIENKTNEVLEESVEEELRQEVPIVEESASAVSEQDSEEVTSSREEAGSTNELPVSQVEPVTENRVISTEDLLTEIIGLSAKMDLLNKLFIDKLKYNEQETKIIDQMHKELQKYKEDLYSQLVRPILLDIIDMRDSILRIADVHLKKPEGEQNIPNKTFSGYALDIQDILEKHNIQIYKSALGDDFVPVKQRPIKKVVTDNEQMHGKVAESFSDGYLYNGRPISAEKVAVYYFEQIKN